jgi:hypothetical protein
MIFHEANKIFLVKQFTFIQLRCTLLTFAFTISDFKFERKISVSLRQFQNFEVSNFPIVKVKKSVLQILT